MEMRHVRLALLLVVILFGGCGREEPAVRLAPFAAGQEEPTLLFEGFRMTSTQGDRKEWVFTARAAQVYERENMAKAQDIRVVYWRDQKPISSLTAKRGFIRTDTNDLRAEGQVVMVSEDGVVLHTEKLQWDNRLGRVFTDQPVLVERGDNILTGVGLEADSALKYLEILSNVNIKVRSIKSLKPALKPGPAVKATP